MEGKWEAKFEFRADRSLAAVRSRGQVRRALRLAVPAALSYDEAAWHDGTADRDFARWRRSEGEVAGAVPSENVSFLVDRSSDLVVTSQSRATVEIRVRVLGVGRVRARVNMSGTAGSATTKVTPRGTVRRSSTYGRD